jgi:HEAT repeat protein
MSKEGKRALWLFLRIAALVVPMAIVPVLTFAPQHRRTTATIDDPNPAVRAAAVRATGWQGHVDLLTQALQDEDADIRFVAATCLSRRREEAGPSAKALTALLKDEHMYVRRQAIEALSAIGAPAVPALLEALADPDPGVRADAIQGLGDIGRPKDERIRSPEERALVLSALQKLRTDQDPEVRRRATRLVRYLHRQLLDGK